jgi:hypothetical protein
MRNDKKETQRKIKNLQKQHQQWNKKRKLAAWHLRNAKRFTQKAEDHLQDLEYRIWLLENRRK